MNEKEIKNAIRKSIDEASKVSEPNFSEFEKNINWSDVAKKAQSSPRTTKTPIWLKPALICGFLALVVGVGIGLPIGIAVSDQARVSSNATGGTTLALPKGSYLIRKDSIPASEVIAFNQGSTLIYSNKVDSTSEGVIYISDYLSVSGYFSFSNCSLDTAYFGEVYKKENQNGVFSEMELNGNAYSIKITIDCTSINIPIISFDIKGVSNGYNESIIFAKS